MIRSATAALLATLACYASAETVQIEHNGRTLNAELTLAEGKSLSDGVLILTHGTLAHNKMELIDGLQSLFLDYDVSTLAINLSLGIDDRASEMYDCAVPGNHSMQEAVAEIGAWQDWLDTQEAGPRILLGHSRGGAQTAIYTASDAERVSGQVLLAPATWEYQRTLDGYESRYSMDIAGLLSEQADASDDLMLEGVSVLYCENSGATLGTLRSYYGDFAEYDTPTTLSETDVPTLVLGGTLDDVVEDLPAKMEALSNESVEFVMIEDADHFFRDLFSDEVVEYAVEFIEAL